jgi:hypothetical protein
MAKVRVQAKTSDDEDGVESAADAVERGTGKPAKRPPKYTSAIDVLRKVLAEKGLKGWYQVCVPPHPSITDPPPDISSSFFRRE